MLKVNETISPHYLFRKTRVNTEVVMDLLIDLSFECPLLGTTYIILCSNSDQDMVHAFDFNTRKDLKEFILASGKSCPECGEALQLGDIRVRFYKKAHNLTQCR